MKKRDSTGTGLAPAPIRVPARRPAAMLALAAGLLAVLAGCGASMDRRAGRDRAGEQWEGAGGSWSLVFNSLGTARALASADPRGFDEYARNDAALGYRGDDVVIASNEWPEREKPDLYYARRLFLDNRPDQLLYFDYESRYRPAYRRGSYEGAYGTWGFWR